MSGGRSASGYHADRSRWAPAGRADRSDARPQGPRRAVETTLKRIRDAGRIPGTLVVEDDIGYYASIGTQFFYIHSDPFLRSGIGRMKNLAGAGRVLLGQP